MCAYGMCLLRASPVARQGAAARCGAVTQPGAAAAVAAQPDSNHAVQGLALHNLFSKKGTKRVI